MVVHDKEGVVIVVVDGTERISLVLYWVYKMNSDSGSSVWSHQNQRVVNRFIFKWGFVLFYFCYNDG